MSKVPKYSMEFVSSGKGNVGKIKIIGYSYYCSPLYCIISYRRVVNIVHLWFDLFVIDKKVDHKES